MYIQCYLLNLFLYDSIHSHKKTSLLRFVWSSAEGCTVNGQIHLLSQVWRSDHKHVCTSSSSSNNPLFEVFLGMSGNSSKATVFPGARSLANWMQVQRSFTDSEDLALGIFRSTTVMVWRSSTLQLHCWASGIQTWAKKYKGSEVTHCFFKTRWSLKSV